MSIKITLDFVDNIENMIQVIGFISGQDENINRKTEKHSFPFFLHNVFFLKA